jgi:hypothetical protein
MLIYEILWIIISWKRQKRHIQSIMEDRIFPLFTI